MSAPRITSDIIDARSEMVRSAISQAAQRTGVDFNYLFNQAKSESGLNPNAHAVTSSASGLYQFIDQSWLGILKLHGAQHGMAWAADAIERGANGHWTVRDPAMRQAVFALRNQPEPSALMAAEFANDNAAGLASALGRQPNAADLYFAHFLGLAGAKRFLTARDSAPDATAANLFPQEAASNRGLFYTKAGTPRSLDELYQLLARKISGGRSDEAGAPATGGSAASAMAGARPGDLVPVPQGSPDADVLRVLTADNMPPSSAASPTTTQSDTMLALMQGRSGINMLRPSPETARLAYMMLASDLADPATPIA